ncbi:FdhF/YdeP family oxidoreductase [Paenibacillus sp. LHD-117]|uniref:FdhF/YdeP family oxidoreductase n=1 Tax=Paenibacillus sp. LHD-117 TaxID=3071412 RepID=UPI0027DF949E|nr:FdhF/YdeP family oxidoreductase [Paenibacillus sp. LHD-117]MDQ6423205.1 FdhF/YdeP family oxidoreductase [Paenibacillus sp. LHD-117]
MGKTLHTGRIKLPKRPDPGLWVSKRPFGLGKIKPHHIRDTMKAAWDNRDNLAYAYRILTEGVCDGCALGVSGLYDQTLEGPHVCTTRLNVLRLNTMPGMAERWLHADIGELRKLSSAELRQLGRLPYPMMRSKGEARFRRVSWDDALSRIAEKARAVDPKSIAFYLTGRGITNETYYAAAKAARWIGTNNIDNASRICHSPSKTALKRSIGVGASTCSYKDWIGTDVLVFWGSVAANNQPVSTKYMYAAKRRGTRIIVVNPYREPAMDGYWIPSIPESALFGTKLADDFYQVNIGGDIAFMHGVMKTWFEMEEALPGSAIDHDFVACHVHGYEELKAHATRQTWEQLESSSGLPRERMREFAELLAAAKSGVFVWSMGLTQHRFGTDNISQVANLALLRGFLGREHCGLMPIRGHSGVQGSGEMGADPFSLPGGEFAPEEADRLKRLWGFAPPAWQGDIVGVSLENALLPEGHERKLKLFYTSGGNFLETMPDPDAIRASLEAVELRVHQDIVLNSSALLDAREDVILLPAMTRYEQPGGGTSTSTERMVYYSPEIRGPRIGEARAEWDIFGELASRVRPDGSEAARVWFKDAGSIRAEIAEAAPYYKGIERLGERGDVFQWGGAWLCEGGECPTKDGKANLIAVELPELRKAEGRFYATTRRGKQFNSMIYGEKDSFNAADRYDVLIHPEDAAGLAIREGDAIVVYNRGGVFHGRAKLAPVAPGNIELFWPEGNVLFAAGNYEPHAGIPEYNASVAVERADVFHALKDSKYVESRIADLDIEAPE